MKTNFSNFVKLFLAGASLLAVGCTDYGQDIQNLNDRIDDLQTDVIDPLAVDLEAVKADLAAAKTDLQAKIDANKALIDGLTDELATAKSNIKANADAIAAAQGDIDNLEKAVETINGQIDNLDKAVEGLKKQDEVFAKDIADLKTAVANNAAEIAANKQDIANLTKKVDDHLAAYALFVEKVDAKFIALDKEIEALKAKDAQIDEAIKALQDKDLELEGKITALQDAYTLLEGRVSTIEQEFADHLAAFAAVVDRVSKLEAGHDAQQILIEANQQAIKNLQDELAKTNGRVATLEAGLEQQKKDLAAAKKELQDNIDALDVKLSDYITKNDAAVKANADAIKKLNDDLTALETKLTNLINSVQEALQKQIDAIKGDLSALKGRIQSLVFVPEHVDGAATIHWAQLGNTLVEGQSVLLYQVYPAECAAAVEAEELQFVFTEELATSRANAPVLEVVNVAPVAKKEGVIAVTVNARNLGADFYAGSVKYAVSLVLANKTANIASCYVNLAPATADQLDVKLINDTAEQYKIEYVDTKTAHVILPDHKYAFSINGEGAYTIEGMLEKGYVITVEKAAPTYAVNDAQLPNVFKNVVDESNPYLNFVTVSIDPNKVTKDSVGLVETVTYSYNVCGKTLTASATVRIVKIQRAIEMKGADIVWTYSQDAMSDAGLELTNSTDVATIVSHTLPADVTYENVLAVAPTVTVTVDGKEDKNVTAIIGGTTDEPTIALSNFAWGKTYTITALYELSSIDVTLTATVNTIDRLRTPVVYDLSKDQWQLTKAFVNDGNVSKTKPEALEALLAILEGDDEYTNYDLTAAKLLEDIFVKKTKTEVNKANGEEESTTKLQFVNNGSQIESVYALADYTPNVPAAIDYVYEVTTWYGQKFTFKKNLNIGLTAVDYALNAEDKTLEHELDFSTNPAESLAPIYDKLLAQEPVTVDKNDFTADEYLKLIFVDKKADNLAEANLVSTVARKTNKADLSNAVLDNTKLVIDNVAGNVVNAKYSYKDFTTTPEKVVYTYSYKTWYGQEITLSKVIKIDLPTKFNFWRVPEWVYVDTTNDTGWYYSKVLADYKYYMNNYSSLDLFSTKNVDMATAFDVRIGGENGQKLVHENASDAVVTYPLLSDYNLSMEFELEESGLVSSFANYELHYADYDRVSVPVKGRLFYEVCVGSTTEKFELTTNFTTDEKYVNYVVKRHEFLKEPTAANQQLTIANAKTYKVQTLAFIDVMDIREYPADSYSLIQYTVGGETLYNRDVALDKLAAAKLDIDYTNITAEINVGDDTNGFMQKDYGNGTKHNALTAYQPLEIKSAMLTKLPSGLENKIRYNQAAHELVVDATAQLNLTGPQDIKIRVEFIYYGKVYKSTELTITLRELSLQ